MAGELFPTTETEEIVIFESFLYRGFALPTCNFFLGLLLKTSLKGWHQRWFYISNPSPSLPSYDGHIPVVRESWTSLPNAVEMKQVLGLINLLKERKSECVTRVRVVLS